MPDRRRCAADSGAAFRSPQLLWLLCPLLMYWVTRVWIFARRRALHDDPILFAIRDRVSWACLLVAGALVVCGAFHWPTSVLFSVSP